MKFFCVVSELFGYRMPYCWLVWKLVLSLGLRHLVVSSGKADSARMRQRVTVVILSVDLSTSDLYDLLVLNLD